MIGPYLVFLATLAVYSVYGQGGQGGSCISPFTLAFGTTNTCYLPLPTGQNGEEYCSALNYIYNPPNRIKYQAQYDICYYVIGFGEGSFPGGCCGGGLPGRR